jgi:hypothetical protein
LLLFLIVFGSLMARLRLKETPLERKERESKEHKRDQRKHRKQEARRAFVYDPSNDSEPRYFKLEQPEIFRVPKDTDAAYDSYLHSRGGDAEGPLRPDQRSTDSSRPNDDPDPPQYEDIKAELEEAQFRAKLFSAMEDDTRLEEIEARFNAYHVPKRWMDNGNPQENLEDMDGDEYIEWLRRKMWERKHKAEQEETVRLEKERQVRRERERGERREARKHEEERRRKRREQQAAKEMMRAWQTYSASWDTLNSNPPTFPTLHFQNIPWPIQHPPTSPEQLTAGAISAFVLSPLHSQGKNRKQRIRDALLVFHPDRFDKWTRLVRNGPDRQLVREAAGAVVRILNALLEVEE